MDIKEEQIVENAIKGDAEAFGLLVQKYYNVVFHLALQLLKNPNNAEDVTQDVFVEVFRNLKYLKETSKFGAWIKGITFNMCKMWLRRYKNAITIGEMDEKIQQQLIQVSMSNYEENLRNGKLRDTVEEAITSLDKTSGLILKLYYMDGLSYKEIGEFLGIPITTVGTKAHRAKECLRNEMIDLIRAGHLPRSHPSSVIISYNGEIIDSTTGIKYSRLARITGKNDIIEYHTCVNISPNERFLLWGSMVIPLNGKQAFDITDMPAFRGSWSPDGKKIVFYSGSIWMVPVSPFTGRPTGPPEKLIDGEYWYQNCVSWSLDSEKLAFTRTDKEKIGDIWTFSLKDKRLTQITDNPLYHTNPVWSPDGTKIAYSRAYNSVYINSSDGGEEVKIKEGKVRIQLCAWSPDNEWLICNINAYIETKICFIRLSDGLEFEITPPLEVGRFISFSSDGKKMLFYNLSYDYVSVLKIVPSSGGPSFEVGKNIKLWPYGQYWTSDGSKIITGGEDEDGNYSFWVLSFLGTEHNLLKIDMSGYGKPLPRIVSPDRQMLAFTVKRNDNMEDLYVVPISVSENRSNGQPVKVFDEWDRRPQDELSWSPDGKKIALTNKYAVWIVSIDGNEKTKIIDSQRGRMYPKWSPKGDMITYLSFYESGKATLDVFNVSNGESKVLIEEGGDYRWKFSWSIDGREIFVINNDLKIIAVSIDDGSQREIIDLKGLGFDRAFSIETSPDGEKLAIIVSNRSAELPDRIYVIPINGGMPIRLASDDYGDKSDVAWSPDGKWISYASDATIKVRDESTLWEADYQEIISNRLGSK